MYARPWAVKVFRDWQICHPRAEDFLRKSFSYYHRISAIPDAATVTSFDDSIIHAIRLSKEISLFSDLWETLKRQVRHYEQFGDSTAFMDFSNQFGAWCFKVYYQGELYP
jgi:hypothetical protein